MNDYDTIPDRLPCMSQSTFRHRLAALLEEFLAGGGDAFWLNRELSLAGMQALDNLRCDLADCDEEGGAP